MSKELDMNKYSKLFVTEARECLRVLNESILQLEKEPENSEVIDQMFRTCHSMKGMAAMMNLNAVTETAHALEDVFTALREKRIKAGTDVTDVVFSTLDALEGMVASIEATKTAEAKPEVVDALKSIVQKSTPAVKAPPEKKVPPKKAAAERDREETTVLAIKFGRRCALPSARAIVILKELEKCCSIVSTTPSEEEIEREHVFEEFVVELEPGPKFNETLKRIVGMNDVDEVRQGLADEPKEKWVNFTKHETAHHAAAIPEAQMPQTVKVGMDKLDDLLDDVGELVIGRSRLLEKSVVHEDPELNDISNVIDKLTKDIQSKVLGIRMIPLEMIMSRFPRMVRDLAKNEGKEVELVVESGNIELDRTVVDKISEPLMHLLRNCVDHGIETVEERKQAGKLPKGLIRIVASRQQDHVLIEVSDDGRGIDFDKIKSAAMKRGILSKEEADKALGRDLMDLLFRPGFSTASQVTEVSGRGVGLDVVKSNVEDLGGSVIVNTSKGAGTTFSLWLPFTLAIIDAMLVVIADQSYAVPMSTIVESHKYENTEIKLVRNREVVQLRGEVLPLIRMREYFGIEPGPKKDYINTLVVQSRDRRAAIEVDDLAGHLQIVVKGLDQRLRKTKGISGGTILGSGKIALILDIDTILGG
jgi:two-component system chemotaxis sensor kinase CheA